VWLNPRYFLIDGSECRDPRTIEGVSSFDYLANYHNSMQGRRHIILYYVILEMTLGIFVKQKRQCFNFIVQMLNFSILFCASIYIY